MSTFEYLLCKIGTDLGNLGSTKHSRILKNPRNPNFKDLQEDPEMPEGHRNSNEAGVSCPAT